MPQILHDAFTVLSPATGMWLAMLGGIAFFVMLFAKTNQVRMIALAVHVVGAFGFANVIVGALH